MIFSKKYSLLAYALFRGQARHFLPYFKQLKMTLLRGKIRLALEEYICSFIFTEILMVSGLGMILLAYLVTFAKMDLATMIATEMIAVIVIAAGILGFYQMYPSIRVGSLKAAQDRHVAFAGTHMATIAGTGVPPQVIFQMIGRFEEYGEVALSCQDISRNISVFGYDIISAISEEAQRTPSHRFKDLLWSIVATIRTGGDLREILMSKSKMLMEEQRRTEAAYVETLSMMAEIYSTVFVAGIVMMFVLVAIMGILGGLPVPVDLVLQLTTYVGVPIGSVMFILVVDSSKPSGV